MAFKNLKLRDKLFLGFGLFLSFLVAVSILGYAGVGSVTQDAEIIIRGNKIDSLLAQKIVDHVNWAAQVNRLWTSLQDRKIDVQTDEHKCGFGLWLYGQGRKDLEVLYPDLADQIKKIEEPHRQLHTSVIEINQLMGRHAERSEGLTASGEVMREKTLPALTQVQDLLNSLRKSVAERMMTDEIMLEKARATRRLIMVITGLTIIAGVILAVAIAASVSRPTEKAVEFVEQLSKGDFTQTLAISQKDEIGRLAESLNHLVSSLGKLFREVHNGIVTLIASSKELGVISGQMSQGAELTSDKARTVAAAAEEMSANMNSVASATEQAAGNVSMVAAAAEEMSTTIQEIARNSEKSRGITHEAVTEAENTTKKMNELGGAARDISKVVEVISEISDQTNLLALNATIEAARAGEAGKGFAVVANEIKELARQTAMATVEIKEKITSIQSSTTDTVNQIREVAKIIDQVNEIGSTITTAVDEQASATQEITRNVSEAAQGIQEVSTNIAAGSVVANEISKDVSKVNMSADDMAVSSSRVNVSAHDLQKLADRLTRITSKFRLADAAFDIGAAKSAHLQWRSRLEGLLHGQQSLRPEEIANHHECAFGKWYDGPDGQRMKAIPAFMLAGQHHEKVHALAKQIVELHHRGEKQKAAGFMSSFEDEREKLFLALDELYLS